MPSSTPIETALQEVDISANLCKDAKPVEIFIHLTSSFRIPSNVVGDIAPHRSKHSTGNAIYMKALYDNK